MNDETPRPPRRKRYGGKNPRRFEDKYKEHDPARYLETIAKVIASGKTPAGSHIPILVAEVLGALQLKFGMTGVDATLGYGGHATKILEKIGPTGNLVGLDMDLLEISKTEARMRSLGFGVECFEAVRSNYAGIVKVLEERGTPEVDFIFADLGCSSMQLDDPARGFSYKSTGPLDMRMNPSRGLSAAEWLVRASVEKLETVLHLNADEPRAGSIAVSLAGNLFANTTSLAQAIRESVRVSDEDERELTVRRVFQAIRIAVNEEFTALDAFLRVLPKCMKSGARAAILTFHSGEDRRVKQAMRQGVRDGIFAEMSDGTIAASAEERRMNPRSSSAKLRWVTRA